MNIDNYPNSYIYKFPLISFFTIDLNQSVKEKLKPGEVLTNATALKIFKQIKLKSDVLSFLTKPIVLIPLSASILVTGFFIPVPGSAVIATAIAVGVFVLSLLSSFVLGYSIQNRGNLSKLSQEYKDQSRRAAEYIRAIKASNQEIVFSLDKKPASDINRISCEILNGCW